MKTWVEVVRKYSYEEDAFLYPRRWFAVIRCRNGRDLMASKGDHHRRASVILAKKVAKYTGLEYRGWGND